MSKSIRTRVEVKSIPTACGPSAGPAPAAKPAAAKPAAVPLAASPSDLTALLGLVDKHAIPVATQAAWCSHFAALTHRTIGGLENLTQSEVDAIAAKVKKVHETPPAAELGLGPIRLVPLAELRPSSSENRRLYRPVLPADPEVRDLAKSIQEEGILQPLVATRDGWIIDGHRRHMAAGLAGLTQGPCRFASFEKADDLDRFMRLLAHYNKQRVKDVGEAVREQVVLANPRDAHAALKAHREAAVRVQEVDEGGHVELGVARRRAAISAAKRPFLAAIQAVIQERREFWPLSDRLIHYELLNTRPLVHASKPASTYSNTPKCYKAVVELLTRARVTGEISPVAIADATRPVEVWDVHPNAAAYVREELRNLLFGYWRDLQQGQAVHVEVVGEKLAIASIVRPVCQRYAIPLTIGKGFVSLPPRYAMAQRFFKSGRDRLVVLFLGDFDPDGESIAESFARRTRDDFGIASIIARKVALTSRQVKRFHLPVGGLAKPGSSRYPAFVKKHGEHTWELEAIPPKHLQELLDAAIRSVIDVDLFNRELEKEASEAAYLDGVRRRMLAAVGDVAGPETGN
jgi:hypothetical protein